MTILGILDACELCFHCDEVPEGNYGIHQRPFDGREHPLCDVCAHENGPSCEVIWREAAARGRA